MTPPYTVYNGHYSKQRYDQHSHPAYDETLNGGPANKPSNNETKLDGIRLEEEDRLTWQEVGEVHISLFNWFYLPVH